MDSKIISLTTVDFERVITNNEIVLIDFWAEWCGPCKSFAKIYEQIAVEYPDIIFTKVNVDEEPELARDFQIRSIPTLMIFRQGIGIFAESGTLPASALHDLIKQARALDMNTVRESLAKDKQD